MSEEKDDVVIEPEGDGDEEAVNGKLKKLRDELKKTKSERDEHLAGWQRSKADYVNLSRRMREQEESLKTQSIARFAQSIIHIFDSLEAARHTAKDAGSTVQNGIDQVVKQLEAALKEHGVERYTPRVGDTFDPERHEPIKTVATESEKDDNTVSEVFQSGYELQGTIIRPARVSVSRTS